jgi:hypothetical protein
MNDLTISQRLEYISQNANIRSTPYLYSTYSE